MTRSAPPPTPPRAALHRGRPRRSVIARRDNRAGLVMVLPTTIIVLAIVIIPVIWNLVLAFQEAGLTSIAGNGLVNPLTLDNFATVLTDPGFWMSLWTTIVYSVFSTAGSIVVGLVAALAFRVPVRGRGHVRLADHAERTVWHREHTRQTVARVGTSGRLPRQSALRAHHRDRVRDFALLPVRISLHHRTPDCPSPGCRGGRTR